PALRALHSFPTRRSSDLDEPAVFMFHNTGLYNLPAPMHYPADSAGLYAVTGNLEDVGKFRVPSLRNIALTAPYMHDGSIATLEEDRKSTRLNSSHVKISY